MNQLSILCAVLARSVVFFSKEEWLPVADAQGSLNQTQAKTNQASTAQQVAVQGGGSDSLTDAVGADANEGGVTVSSQSDLGRIAGGTGNTDNTTIESSDPAVVESSLLAGAISTGQALQSNTAISVAALNDTEGAAVAAIQNGAETTAMNDQFGESALQSAADSEANDTTAFEATATEEAQVATNALAAAQNETLAGVTPAQEFQSINPLVGSSGSTASTWATWLSIAAAVFAIVFYLRKAAK